VTLTHDITMPRGTNNTMCHTQGPDTWYFYLFFSKKKKQILTGDTLLTVLVNSV